MQRKYFLTQKNSEVLLVRKETAKKPLLFRLSKKSVGNVKVYEIQPELQSKKQNCIT